MAYQNQTEDRRAYNETARRDPAVRRDAERSTGSIVAIVVVALIALGLLYWAATLMWAPTTTTDITVTPAPTETIPAPAPDTMVPPPAETAPAEPAPPAIEPEPAPAPAQ